VSVFHWTILLLQLQVYTRLPGWFFFFHPRSYAGREWLFLILLAGSLLIFYCATRIRGWRAVLLLMVWGYVLQLGFMWIDWGSLERMSDKYIMRYAPYAEAVSTEPQPPLELIRNYQELYSKGTYTGTKPPGFMLSYWFSQQLVTWNLPQLTPAEKTERLSVFITLFYPALATLVLIPLYLLSKNMLEVEKRTLPLLIYLSFPGILLISLIFDQMLYPGLFVLIVWLAIKLVEKGNFWLAMGLGSLIYLALFMTFALLPAIFMVFVLIGLHFLLFNRGWLALKRSMILAFGLFAGFMVVYFIFSTFLGYDVLTRYFQAMESHHLAKRYSGDLASLPLTILINNIDFGLGSGFPTPFLLLILAARSVYALFRRQVTRLDWVTLSFFSMFLVLNVAGQTRTETARLWLFLLPFIAIFEADFLDKLFAKRTGWLYWLVALQLITAFLVFKFEGLY
jgi:hypothetical protein